MSLWPTNVFRLQGQQIVLRNLAILSVLLVMVKKFYNICRRASSIEAGKLLRHFENSLKPEGKENFAVKMINFWKAAGHDESTLRAFVEKHRPDKREKLRVLLVSELMKAFSNQSGIAVPDDVPVDLLLANTCSFFMPEDSTSDESRARSLEPFRKFVIIKMKAMAAVFGIKDDYIKNVSMILQNSVAKSGLGLDEVLRRTDDEESFDRRLTESLKNVSLPKNVTPDFVKTMIADFVEDFLGR